MHIPNLIRNRVITYTDCRLMANEKKDSDYDELLVSPAAVLEPPEIDLCFAISATAAEANTTFSLMRETMKDVIDNYGIDKIRYSVIVFGSQARKVLGFDSDISDPVQLEALISSLSPISGDSALDKALEKVLESFGESVTRPNAKRVVVVITDNESGLEEDVIAAKARPLEQRNIRVIAVAVGDEANQQELETTASDKRDVLSVTTSVQPKKLAKDIMVLVLTGMLALLAVLYYRHII